VHDTATDALAPHALMLHQWFLAPDRHDEGDVQQAERELLGSAAAGDTRCSPRPAAPMRRMSANSRRAGPLPARDRVLRLLARCVQ
jgi:hypothetical protein